MGLIQNFLKGEQVDYRECSRLVDEYRQATLGVYPITDYIIFELNNNLEDYLNTDISLNIYKENTNPTKIYMDGTLIETITTSGDIVVALGTIIGEHTLKIEKDFQLQAGVLSINNGGGVLDLVINKIISAVIIGKSFIRNIGKGTGVFYSASNLVIMQVEAGNSRYDSRNNCNAIIETSTNKLVYGCKTTLIPDDVTIIGGGAYAGLDLTTITIPSQITEIGDGAFGDLIHTNSLQTIYWDAVNATLSSTNGPFVNSYSTTSCEVIIGDSVLELPARLFLGNSLNANKAITSVIIGNSVIRIGDSCFSGQSKLTNLIIPASVQEIGALAFANTGGAMALSTVTFMHTATDSLTMAAAGQTTGVFRVKTARAMTINYYGNSTVANYDYSADNITATLNVLS